MKSKIIISILILTLVAFTYEYLTAEHLDIYNIDFGKINSNNVEDLFDDELDMEKFESKSTEIIYRQGVTWFVIAEIISFGHMDVPWKKLDEYMEISFNNASNILSIGAKRGDARCNFYLGTLNRHGNLQEFGNKKLSDKYLDEFIKIMSNKTDKTREEIYLLHRCYDRGMGVEKDEAKAKELLEQCKAMKP